MYFIVLLYTSRAEHTVSSLEGCLHQSGFLQAGATKHFLLAIDQACLSLHLSLLASAATPWFHFFGNHGTLGNNGIDRTPCFPSFSLSALFLSSCLFFLFLPLPFPPAHAPVRLEHYSFHPPSSFVSIFHLSLAFLLRLIFPAASHGRRCWCSDLHSPFTTITSLNIAWMSLDSLLLIPLLPS
ncbi:hypothetical protein BC939DRAFT_194713 [Gamsiella multidivaricata]|uniref:uncharacterized protein n=1 Tax=Gamsiella multidivaricata TaxID=101098 RepID=UPI00221E3C57|nr:uncharacterized protein BC939DRAFT_194713 [Gamsiella multidivaricata]KAI7821969.1 hypothetical protein BC939DRAFT_194713 [Gamsiella multidivaricata]